jgi:RNA polymerase sigma-70 factor (ECF subfamily)
VGGRLASVVVPGAGESFDGRGDSAVAEPVRSDGVRGREVGGDWETIRWLRELTATGLVRDRALAELHSMLLRVARAELRRRPGHDIGGPELDDLAQQAAGDAVVAIVAKLDRFRGESRFTTWAYRFVVLEVSSKLGRHFWRRPGIVMEAGDWERLPDRFGVAPDAHAERLEMIRVVSRAVAEELTDHQREVFVALVLDGVPLDALVLRLGSSRNAIYKTMFDARRKLRIHLAANGYMDAAAPADGGDLEGRPG